MPSTSSSSPSRSTPSTNWSACARWCRAPRRASSAEHRQGGRRRMPRPRGRRRPRGSMPTANGATACIYDRSKLKPGNKIAGPAIVTEMDSTSLILPGHVGYVDTVGNILIWPTATRTRLEGTQNNASQDHRTQQHSLQPGQRSIRSRSTSSRTRCAMRAPRWTRCCSARPCRRAFASSTTPSR